ncbi:MAG: 16S rRNA (guanine(527)-N(7))-methyltransferase RsmG [Burkholderiaceae bacterium]|nr:16S rRNA (guanine(527)-N(7))-methyltransferase RsmG [Burkholderiaceae bacterium]
MTAVHDSLLAAAARLGLDAEQDLTARKLDQLLAYLALLQRWNKVYNLTAVRDPAEMLSHHLLDCLAVVAPLRRQIDSPAGAGRPCRLLDVGSGGGLPGVVLAIIEPALTVDCVDTVAKKASFIRQVAAELGLPNLQGLHARVETLAPARQPYQVITSRAFASLPDFISLTRSLLAPGGQWMAMKGRTPAEELAALPGDIEVFHVEQLQVPDLDAQRCLVWMRPRPGPDLPSAATVSGPAAA